ncbi:hypothetical protein OUZ56_004320 [Daphnia magna]|uniref:Uncharacterized protein n=1 Tax=Daphnia magna TaxID=35525 RepID=A0ABQ9YPH4_9CRUS|nr:hypothetical protein OUZ56_004320 [Daphnia magna]
MASSLTATANRQCFEMEEARAGMFCPPYEQLYFLDWKEMITMRPKSSVLASVPEKVYLVLCRNTKKDVIKEDSFQL